MKHILNKSDLQVQHAKQVYLEGIKILKQHAPVEIDALGVSELDSTGIAVLCAWWQYASVNRVECRFTLNTMTQEMLLKNGIELP